MGRPCGGTGPGPARAVDEARHDSIARKPGRLFGHMRTAVRALPLLLLVFWATPSVAQELQLSVEDEELYAELPFTLSVVATGFDESPEPTLSPLKIDGAEIISLGVRPSIQSRTTIINGRRSDSRTVTFIYSYRVTVPKAGSYTVEALTALQGSKSASTTA
ncbi:MAG: BatD family protein, partial [Myxococcota bacterium]|nr:BatD family protein [Myxococcota bacterium]